MGSFEHDWRCESGFQRFDPTAEAQAPAVAGFESGELKLGAWFDEVVTHRSAVDQKILCHHRADGVHAGILT